MFGFSFDWSQVKEVVKEIVVPVSFVVGGYLVGFIFEKIILARLKKLAAKTKWEGDDIIISSLQRMVVFWFSLTGLYLAVSNIKMGQKTYDFLNKTFLVIAIFSITIVLAKMVGGFIKLYTKKIEAVLPTTSIFVNITRLIVFIIGFLIILQSLEISITPILTALGVGGLAVALALQDTLANLFSGLHIIASRQLKPGDYIKLDSGEEGYVLDVTWRNTTIRTLPNNKVVIPNTKLSSAIVTNYNEPDKEMAVLVQVGVAYSSDLEKVEKVTIEVAKEVMKEVQGGVPEFEPFIRYHTFADFSINFTVILRGKEFVDQYLIKHEFVKRLHKRYREENIEIPFPIRTVFMKSEERS